MDRRITSVVLAVMMVVSMFASLPANALTEAPASSYLGNYNAGDKGVIGDNVDVVYTVLIGETLNFTGNCTDHSIIGLSAEVEDEAFGTATHDYGTKSEGMTTAGTYYVDINENGSYEPSTDVKLSVKKPSLVVDIVNKDRESIESVTRGYTFYVNLNDSNLFTDDEVKVKITDPEEHTWTEITDDTEIVTTHAIDTDGWDTGTYTISVETDDDHARGLDVGPFEDKVEVKKKEIKIEAETTTPTVGDKVKFTVTGPAKTEFDFSTTDKENVEIVPGYYDDPTTDEPTTWDPDKGEFTGTTDKNGVYEFLAKFKDSGTYTFTVENKTLDIDDDIDIDVSSGEVTVETPEPVSLGDDFTIEGTSTYGDHVWIVVEDYAVMEADITDNTYESDDIHTGDAVENLSRTLYDADILTDPGTYEVGIYVDENWYPGYELTSDDKTRVDASTAVSVISGKLSVSPERPVSNTEDDLKISGTATGIDNVPMMVADENGWVWIHKTSDVTDNEFDEERTFSTPGTYTAFVLHVGDNEESEDALTDDGLFACYDDVAFGESRTDVTDNPKSSGYSVDAMKDIIRDRMDDDDVLRTTTFEVEEPSCKINVPASVSINETLTATVTTNYEDDTIAIFSLKSPDGTLVETVTDEVKDYNASADFSTADLSEGTYSVEVSVGTVEDSADVEVVSGPAPAAPEIGVTSVDISPTEVAPGKDVTITATIENTYDVEKTYTANITLWTGESISETVTVPADGSNSTSITRAAPKEPGTYTVTADGKSTTFTVKAPAAEFEVTNLSLEPTEISVGESTTITATVENVGEASGTTTIEIAVAGETVHTENVTLDAGGSTDVSTEYTGKAKGTPTVTADGMSKTLTVTPKAPGFLAVYAIAAVLAVAYLLLRRRK